MQMTFHDDAIDALNLTVVQQANEISRLQQDVAMLKQQLLSVLDGQTNKIDDELPPHY